MVKKRRPTTGKKLPPAVKPVRIKPPAALDAQEQAVWDELIEETPWLTKYDRFNLHMFACALAKYRQNPKLASNALHARLKSLGSKLRFDSPEAQKLPPRRTAASEFFDDAPESPEERRKRLAVEEFFQPPEPDLPEEEEE